MTKKNAFADLMTDQPAPEATVVKPAEKPPVKQGRGRPKKAVKGDVQMTTIRLDADAHVAIRTLALRDGMTMNELIQAALRDYCHKRGVKIS
jgi:hypothetical protein